MSRAVFVDTSAWLPVVSVRQAYHGSAVETYTDLLKTGVRFVTSNLVVAEMHALVVRERGVPAGIGLLEQLYADPTHEVRYVDRDIERRAIDRWLRPFADQRFSLTDVVSFEMMRSEGIRTAFALDHHFQAAGFEIIPEETPR